MKHLVFFVNMFFFLSTSAQDWNCDYKDVLEKASTENKHILLVFSGSDWCAPCIKLDKEIWQSDTFKKYAEENLMLYKADFPRKKKNKLPEELILRNKKLADKYNPLGYFPLVLLLDKNENILGKLGYKNNTPSEYVLHLTTFVK